MDSPRRLRNRAACRRCHRRKIRCDGNTPSCTACQKAGAVCINDGTQEVHRSYIANMENRIKWLESIVKDKCSDINLNQGPEGQLESIHDAMQPGISAEPADDHDHSSQRTMQASTNERQDISDEAPPSRHSTSHLSQGVRDEPQQAHEIGLVSLSPGGDPRYIGPSSGYFFAKRIFSNTGRTGSQAATARSARELSHLPVELLNAPAPLPPQKQVAVELSTKYFRSVQFLYPLLHEPSHMKAIDSVYASEEQSPVDSFQVYMVLAIASLDLSRQCKLHLPVEGYYASAMKYADFVCQHGSLPALQCLLLLMVYALYNPSCNINIWNLNYQCLASVIDLGLQRDVRASSSMQISLFDQEMRTRVFWVAYTFDRTVCTMMGRPIGIRDEACEIRFPLDISDTELASDTAGQTIRSSPSHMAYSIHLFRLAQLNSEIKYVMHSVRRDAPAWALPPARDIVGWQQDMIATLRDWASNVPQTAGAKDYGREQYCKVKYHETMILVLRPSPGIPHPTDEMFGQCFHHAFMLIQAFGELYRTGNLPYSRLVVHSVFLGTLVMLHCIWRIPGTAAKLRVDELISKFNISQNILSSIGEHWAEATKARDCIAGLSGLTVQRLLNGNSLCIPAPATSLGELGREHSRMGTGQMSERGSHDAESNSLPQPTAATIPDLPNLFDDLLQGDFQWSGMSDIDGFMWEIFNSTHSEL
ncbi:putative Zn(II)2Cys6 transcription factor [Aspergillus ambiguus]|uniref:putative Zn(II)2Cys6 transcription factor n=1 Tax=Aspergillus ambiguus TaxID=176160 RepID=UPI003CCD0C78